MFDHIRAFYQPKSVREAVRLLHSGPGRVLGGGTDLALLQDRSIRFLVDVKHLGLDYIRRDGNGCDIGTACTMSALEHSPIVRGLAGGILARAAATCGSIQIRNLATIGGNLANASPSAEFAPPLLALGASVQCVGCGSERAIPIDEFFLAPGKTALRKDELITEIRVPSPAPGLRSLYLKHALRKMDVAVASASVCLVLEGDRCTHARIALGAVGPVPFRSRKAEAALAGQRLAGGRAESELFEQAARLASEESVPIDDLRAYADYRKKLVAMLVGKALERLMARPA